VDESDLKLRLRDLTRPGDLGFAEKGKVRCVACGHRCLIGEGHEGICRVRFVEQGALRVPWGYVGALNVDPIEKKPFYHVTPGALALSFGMLGCDYKCPYCQNWEISQVHRDPESDQVVAARPVRVDDLIGLAQRSGSTVVTSTYNEPLITSEWAVAVFRAARAAGLMTGYVSNGNGTPEVLDYLRPWVDAYKVDLKGMREEGYRSLGGKLATVLSTLEGLKARGFWVEVVTLVVPGLNDSDAELRDAARFLAGLDRDIPWHVTAYHDDYRMDGRGRTAPASLLRAAGIGREEGLRFVYAGNLPGSVGEWEDTRCPACGTTVVERRGFQVVRNGLSPEGACPSCGQRLPGLWSAPVRLPSVDAGSPLALGSHPASGER
jgi:pyruvate formate lyase activating enzyme